MYILKFVALICVAASLGANSLPAQTSSNGTDSSSQFTTPAQLSPEEEAKLRQALRDAISNSRKPQTPAAIPTAPATPVVPETPPAPAEPVVNVATPAAPAAPEAPAVPATPAAPEITPPPAPATPVVDVPTPAVPAVPTTPATPEVTISPAPAAPVVVVPKTSKKDPSAAAFTIPADNTSTNQLTAEEQQKVLEAMRQQKATLDAAQPVVTTPPPVAAHVPAKKASAKATTDYSKNPYMQAAAPAAPVMTVPGSKEQKLADLLQLYKQDQITPSEYHERRAKILAGQ